MNPHDNPEEYFIQPGNTVKLTIDFFIKSITVDVDSKIYFLQSAKPSTWFTISEDRLKEMINDERDNH